MHGEQVPAGTRRPAPRVGRQSGPNEVPSLTESGLQVANMFLGLLQQRS